VTICPCCGFKSSHSGGGVSNGGCLSCGALSVGEPLPRPEHELPSYGRSLLLVVIGALSVLVFTTETLIALFARKSFSFGFWSWMAALETAAWHLKWAMIPVAILVCFGTRKIYRSILQTPDNFCGLRYARNGYFASAAVPLLVLILIGITVPARLSQRQDRIEAGIHAQGYRIDRALVEYREAFGTLPSDFKDLSRLPDADGSLAAALQNVDVSGYTVDSELAAVPTKKPRPLRGAVILNASVGTASDDPLSGGISFTNYRLRVPGSDKVLGTDDDLILMDGAIYKLSEVPKRMRSTTAPAQTLQR
jgi:hypothetical protein